MNKEQIQLPLEIWQRISEHMPSKDWVGVSRTNRVTYAVQPERIDLQL